MSARTCCLAPHEWPEADVAAFVTDVRFSSGHVNLARRSPSAPRGTPSTLDSQLKNAKVAVGLNLQKSGPLKSNSARKDDLETRY